MMIQMKHEMIMMCAFALLLLGSAKVMVAGATTDPSSNEIDGNDDSEEHRRIIWNQRIDFIFFVVCIFSYFCSFLWVIYSTCVECNDDSKKRLMERLINTKIYVAPRIVNNKSMQDIIQSLPSYAFSTTTADVEEGTSHPRECGICISNFKDDDILRMLPNCDHTFHVSCIDPWLALHSDCPMCRMKVVIDAPTTNTHANAMPPSDPLEVVVNVDASRPDM